MSVEELRTRLRTVSSKRENEIHAHQEELRLRMEEMEGRLAAFQKTSSTMLTSLVEPRFAVLAEQFTDIAVEPADDRRGVYARFNTERRIPATVKLELSLHLDVDAGTGYLLYLVEILPVLMDYERTAQIAFDLESPDVSALESFVDRMLLEFMETYVRLEGHPAYQLNNLLKDPVCGMQLSPSHAGASATIGTTQKRTFYFCVDACRDRFLANPGKYVPLEEPTR